MCDILAPLLVVLEDGVCMFAHSVVRQTHPYPPLVCLLCTAATNIHTVFCMVYVSERHKLDDVMVPSFHLHPTVCREPGVPVLCAANGAHAAPLSTQPRCVGEAGQPQGISGGASQPNTPSMHWLFHTSAAMLTCVSQSVAVCPRRFLNLSSSNTWLSSRVERTFSSHTAGSFWTSREVRACVHVCVAIVQWVWWCMVYGYNRCSV